MEQAPGETYGRVIDLDNVRSGERAACWNDAVVSTFPTLSVKFADPRPLSGSIDRVALGASEVCTVQSAPADVLHKASQACRGDLRVSLMIQAEGCMEIRQAGRSAVLQQGDMCLLDEAKSFRLIGSAKSMIKFVRLPRAAVLSRYPLLEKLFAMRFTSDQAGTAMLSDTLERVLRDCGNLRERQRNALSETIIHMLGLAGDCPDEPEGSDWRVQRALDFIELHLASAGLTADAIAQDQNISRRRLDQLMHEAFGCSLAARLWSRRLERAAADLRDPARSRLSIAQIAFANGFGDPAHFTRAFKRRFAVTPGQWRLL